MLTQPLQTAEGTEYSAWTNICIFNDNSHVFLNEKKFLIPVGQKTKQ